MNLIIYKMTGQEFLEHPFYYFVGKSVDNLLITFYTTYLFLISKQVNHCKLMENGTGKFW